jgi:hypothetical protein
MPQYCSSRILINIDGLFSQNLSSISVLYTKAKTNIYIYTHIQRKDKKHDRQILLSLSKFKKIWRRKKCDITKDCCHDSKDDKT